MNAPPTALASEPGHTPPCATQASRQSYIKSVALLVELASLQTAFLTLDEAIKTTNRRVNALDSVVKPMLENTIQYIKVRVIARVVKPVRENSTCNGEMRRRTGGIAC